MHTMTKVRWALLAVGILGLVLTFVATSEVTARFIAAYAFAGGLAVLLVSERIIVSTRDHPQTRLANARQGTIDR